RSPCSCPPAANGTARPASRAAGATPGTAGPASSTSGSAPSGTPTARARTPSGSPGACTAAGSVRAATCSKRARATRGAHAARRRRPASASGVEPDRQRLQLVDEQRFRRARRTVDLDPRVALQRLLDKDPQLQARERGAEAVVPATGPEGLVLGFARHVEAVGVLVARLIAVRGHVPHHHLLAGLDL